MLAALRHNLIGIRGAFVWHYLLLDEDRVVALDAGMGRSWRWVVRWFDQTGRRPSDLKAIILTHAHLDHAGGADALQRWSGAPVYLHPADEPLLRGHVLPDASLMQHLEGVGRTALRYMPPAVVRPIEEAKSLDLWGGLDIRPTPGHTAGHVSFWFPSERILFPGDLMLSSAERVFLPLSLLNQNSQQNRQSLETLLPLEPDFVYPMHHQRLTTNLWPAVRRRFKFAGGTPS